MNEKMIKRLFMYYTMRDDYERSLKLTYNQKCKINTERGFCLYTNYTFKIKFTERNFPEIFKFQPNGFWCFWFPEGKIPPRLEIINNAIVLLEEKLNK